MTAQDRLRFSTTLIKTVWANSRSTASGFFFAEYDSKDDVVARDTQSWLDSQNVWLVTNRHVLVSKSDEFAKTLTFSVRYGTVNCCTRLPISLSGSALENHCKFHQEYKVDVAVIRVDDILRDWCECEPGIKQGVNVCLDAVSESMFPFHMGILIGSGDACRFVGYPHGFYDKLNDFPFVRLGCIATGWGDSYEGAPCFLIDGKLFPGSSGSLVISVPTVALIENGGLNQSRAGSKKYAFLGVLSAGISHTRMAVASSPIFFTETELDLGIVWYSRVIPEIISDGISFNELVAKNS